MRSSVRGVLRATPALAFVACSLVAGLGPQPGALPSSVDGGVSDGALPDALSETGQGIDAPSDTGGDTDSSRTGDVPIVAGCRMFPADNPWNRDISNDPVDTVAMANIMPNMVPTMALHADWGDTINGYGIPFTVSQAPPAAMTFVGATAAQSDVVVCPTSIASPICYPIAADARVELDADHHVLVLDTTNAPNNCTLYELFHAVKNAGDPGWTADIGAAFNLGSDALRPDGWASADPAGLAVMPGLVRFEETSLGEIKHAMRFTMHDTFNGYIHPATHAAGLAAAGLPPMGLRLRLKASFDLSGVSGLSLVILHAMQKYGIILADKGTSWYITGDTNDGWTAVLDDIVTQMTKVHGNDFEIVQSGPVSTVGL